MERYRDWDRDSNVAAFAVGEGFIDVEFKSGAVYRYTEGSVGTHNLERMIALARAGEGLNAFINKHVKTRYYAKMRE